MFASNAFGFAPPALPITFRSAAAGVNSNSQTSITVNKPSGTVQGDVMVAIVYWNANCGALTVPSGWISATERLQLTSATGEWSNNVFMHYKVAGASEPSSYTWTATNAVRSNAAISTFSGVSNSTPVNVSANSYVWSTGAPSAALSPNLTTTVNNAMLVLGTSLDQGSGGSFTPASGMTTAILTSGGNGPLGLFYSIQAASGSTGVKSTPTTAPEGNASAGSFFLALTPA